ncbi:MAG TPA: ribosome biogenesis GTPase Der [Dehalococcoidia bacterium]|nr:ribosome biogenesis GTPase Der [Dehalococcoidia bacterium]
MSPAPRAPAEERPATTQLPLVVIVGRPNVGKSALFNRILGERRAVVEDLPGTTRDRVGGEAEWAGRRFRVFDTGGFEEADTDHFSPLVREQIRVALEQADVILFVVDAISGLVPADEEVASLVRPTRRPVLIVANKADNQQRADRAVEFYELGLGDPYPVSAIHGAGAAELLDEIVSLLPPPSETSETEAEGAEIALAIVGRPNVGKSTLLNTLVGEERAIVSEVPGTTRDIIDTVFEHGGRRLRLLDTAGIRRRGRIERGVEKHSVLRSEEAIDRCDVAILLLDGPEGITAQDTHIAGYVAKAAKGLVVAVNKWDAMPPEHDPVRYTRWVSHKLRFVPWADVCLISAKQGTGLETVLSMAEAAYRARASRVGTGELNRVIQAAVSAHPPGLIKGKRLRIYYATQADISPPTFVFFVNDAKLLHFSYRRYLENSLRSAFGFRGTAVRLVFREREALEQRD